MTEHVPNPGGALANVSRRNLLQGIGAGVFVLAAGLPVATPAQDKKFGADGMPNGWRDDPAVFIALAEDGTVTITCHRSEMGQGVRTSLAMAPIRNGETPDDQGCLNHGAVGPKATPQPASVPPFPCLNLPASATLMQSRPETSRPSGERTRRPRRAMSPTATQ